MKVLILGRTEILYETVRLLAQQHNICGIITAPAAPEYTKTEQDFATLATELGCPFLSTKKLDGPALQLIKAIKPDVTVSINWVGAINEDVIGLIPYGILNAHPSDLPRYRGNAATNWAILLHDTHITLTIHFMEPNELDSGDILVQRTLGLTQQTTIKEVIDFWAQQTPAMFMEALAGLETGTLRPKKQSETGQIPFRCYPRLPVYSKINWENSAKDIDALVRASTHPYSGAYSYLKEDNLKKIYIWRSRVVAETTNDIGIPGHIIKNDPQTGESWVLTGKGIIGISLVQYEDQEAFEPGKRWKSIRIKFGVDVESELLTLYNQIEAIKNYAS